MIKELDLARDILASLKRGDLTENELLLYFQSNSVLLRNNIESAYARYGTECLPELVKDNLARYFENKERILSNEEDFSVVRDQVIDRVQRAFDDIPELCLVPCIGLFSANGWAQELDGKHHVCMALEFPQEHMGITLAHEIAHGLGEAHYKTVLNGFYNEGFATFVSSVIYPGCAEEEYLFRDKDWYLGCLGWIDRNRNKILKDSAKPFQVLDEHHLFYFGGGNVNHPRVGYAIGYEYLKFLSEKCTIEELCTFGQNESMNETKFKEFILDQKQ